MGGNPSRPEEGVLAGDGGEEIEQKSATRRKKVIFTLNLPVQGGIWGKGKFWPRGDIQEKGRQVSGKEIPESIPTQESLVQKRSGRERPGGGGKGAGRSGGGKWGVFVEWGCGGGQGGGWGWCRWLGMCDPPRQETIEKRRRDQAPGARKKDWVVKRSGLGEGKTCGPPQGGGGKRFCLRRRTIRERRVGGDQVRVCWETGRMLLFAEGGRVRSNREGDYLGRVSLHQPKERAGEKVLITARGASGKGGGGVRFFPGGGGDCGGGGLARGSWGGGLGRIGKGPSRRNPRRGWGERALVRLGKSPPGGRVLARLGGKIVGRKAKRERRGGALMFRRGIEPSCGKGNRATERGGVRREKLALRGLF